MHEELKSSCSEARKPGEVSPSSFLPEYECQSSAKTCEEGNGPSIAKAVAFCCYFFFFLLQLAAFFFFTKPFSRSTKLSNKQLGMKLLGSFHTHQQNMT